MTANSTKVDDRDRTITEQRRLNREQAAELIQRAAARPSTSVVRQLLPFSFAGFSGFLAIGIPLPVLSLQTENALGFGSIAVGIVVGSQSLATLASRQFAGRMCDERGPKRTTLLGLLAASLSGLLYVISNSLLAHPALALSVLMAGRLMLGLGESLFITAIASWSVAVVGAQNAGRAMAWSGISMYAAIAIGAPIGVFINGQIGFGGIGACAILLPLVAAAVAAFWTDVPVARSPRASYIKIIAKIWTPGLGMALASSGVGTIAAFLALLYQNNDWPNSGFALTGFGSSYILVRLIFGGLPDRIGGYPSAVISLLVETAGLIVIWLAQSPELALAGAILTGAGYSLVFPSLGVEALKLASAESRGIVLGAYLACFDFGLAIAGPAAGLVATNYGLPLVFPAASVATILAWLMVSVSWIGQVRSRPV